MTSKNLFFNLMKENTKRRLWIVALIFLVFFFVFPVGTALMISDYLNPEEIARNWVDVNAGMEEMKMQFLLRYQEWTNVKNGLFVFMMPILAVLCGTSGFSYLHSKRKTDFFHSVPVKREKLFAAIYLNGILYTAVPYLISLTVSAIMVQVKVGAAAPWGSMLTGYGVHMVFYLLVYSTVVVAVMMTGNTIVSLLGTVIFFSWAPAVSALMYSYCYSYYRTFYNTGKIFSRLSKYGSPMGWYIDTVSFGTKLMANTLGALAAAAVLTALAVVPYKKRPSEAAGRAMAFQISRPVIKLLLVVPVALAGSLFFYEMKQSDGWSIFGLLCGLLICYCIVEIIYNSDFRRLFAHKEQLAVCAVLSTALLVLFRFDLLGYDSYIPAANKVETSVAYSNYVDGRVDYMYLSEPSLIQDSHGNDRVDWDYGEEAQILERMRLTNTEDVLAIAGRGVEEVKTLSARNVRYEPLKEADPNEVYSTVVVGYNLKNGKTAFRSYYMNLTAVEKNIASVYRQKEYKEAVYPILTADVADIASMNYQEYGEMRHINLPNEAMKEEILQTYQEELMALTVETRKNESPVAAIQFKNNEIQAMIDTLRQEGSDFTTFNQFYYYPIYPSFTKTAALLNECGIEVGTFLSHANVEKIELIGSSKGEIVTAESGGTFTQGGRTIIAQSVKESISERETLVIKDKLQIQEILKADISGGSICENTFNKAFDNLEVNAYVPLEQQAQGDTAENRGDEYTDIGYADVEYAAESYEAGAEYKIYRLSLDKDKAPEFLRKGMPGSFD